MARSQHDSELDEAVEFVCARVEEQARRENLPLDESERLMLRNPPADYFTFHMASDSGPVLPNGEMDRIVRLVVVAHEYDETSSADMQLRWKLVVVLLKMARHPLSLLLEAADLKPQVNIPWWDKWLLWSSALALIIATLPITLLANSAVAGAIAFFAGLGIAYLFIRTQEDRRLLSAATKYRQALSIEISAR